MDHDIGRPIAEDILGFGVFRTAFDLFRGYIFKSEDKSKRELNLPAARERVIRESGMLFASNFLDGLAFWAIYKTANLLGLKTLSRHYIRQESLSLFKTVAGESGHEQDFVRNLARQISPEKAEVVYDLMRPLLLKTGGETPPVAEVAAKIVKTLKPEQTWFDWTLKLPSSANGGTYRIGLDQLLTEADKFLSVMREGAEKGDVWKEVADKLLSQTRRFNLRAMAPAMTIAGVFTLAVPYYNKILTRKIDKTDDYPGLKGLVELKRAQENQSWLERTFPFLHKTLSSGNPLPALSSLIPLPFALGLTDNVALWKGDWKNALNLPFTKDFFNRIGRMFQFQGRTGSLQQLSALCALVCTARVITARDRYEFRERVVDTYGAWATWIVLLPWMARKVYTKLDRLRGTKMMKEVVSGVWDNRSPQEIQQFFKKELADLL